jgi:hypothetical protein
VTDPGDHIGSWLDAGVQPLAAPPGAFEQIRKRAWRRKVTRAIASVAGAAVIIAGLAALPRVIPSLPRPGSRRAATSVSGSPPAPHRPAVPSQAAATPSPSGTLATTPASTLANPTTSVPVSFRPTSVTFAGAGTGAVIGQAGIGGRCASDNPTVCTSMAATHDYGVTWRGMNPPDTPGPDGSTGVSQLRFLNDYQGWAFGPALFATQDSGKGWVPDQTFGRVIGLEALDQRVFALEAKGCSGTGTDFGAGCTSFTLYAADASGGAWVPVPGATGLSRQGRSDSASLVLVGGRTQNPADDRGYLLAPDGTVLSGALSAGASWKPAARPGCLPGTAQADGQPSGALMAAGSGRLYLVCATGSGSTLSVRHAGGSGFRPVGTVSVQGAPVSLAAASDGVVVLATSAGLGYSRDGGKTWRPASSGTPLPRRGFSYVGMTNQSQGVALPADSHLGEVWTTTDGGISWTPRPVSG